MGSIVSFVPRPAAKSRRSDDRSIAASVIIFPGVRYERPAVAEADGAASAEERSEQRNPTPLHH